MTVPEPTANRPLVTFAVIAYNQQEFVRDAVESAFAQTYSPLEIVLSDDGSRDRTFEIMKEMAASYTGPHKVIVRQSRQASGILNHVLDAVQASSGQLYISCAGDDISRPDRTEKLVEAWASTGAWGLCSRFDVIDAKGALLETNQTFRRGREYINWFGESEGFPFVHGASSAYDRRLLAGLPRSPEPVNSEDVVFTLCLRLRGKSIHHVEEPLLRYRKHGASLSHGEALEDDREAIAAFEAKIARAARTVVALAEYCLALTEGYEGDEVPMIRQRIEATRRFALIRSRLPESSLGTRVQLLLMSRQPRELRYLAPRLFGQRWFIRSKMLARKSGLLLSARRRP